MPDTIDTSAPTYALDLDWDRIRQRRLFVAAPLYGGLMHFSFHQSLSNLVALGMREHVFVGQKFILNDSLVMRARNRLCEHFLDSDCTDLLFVDSDIGFYAEDALSLLQFDEPIVGGIYSRKQLDWGRIARAAKANVPPALLPKFGTVPVLNWAGPVGEVNLTQLLPVRHMGTGFLRIRREVLVRMMEHYGEGIEFDQAGDEPVFKGRVGHDFFPSGVDTRHELGTGKRQYLSEDWMFCERATELGYTIYAAPWIRLVHVGYHEFVNDLSALDEAYDSASVPPAPLPTVDVSADGGVADGLEVLP